MLVTRQCETGRNTWSSIKLEAIYQGVLSPRMSNFEPLSTQPEWREKYSEFPLREDNSLIQPTLEHSATSNISDNDQASQPNRSRPALEHRHSLGTIPQEPRPITIVERPDSAPGSCGRQVNNTVRDASLVSTKTVALSLASHTSSQSRSATCAIVQQSTVLSNEEECSSNVELKEEEDDDDDEEEDDDMLDIEEGSAPQTAAERRAERRKMKRFRLTHQQTRFLMSEFAKQAHPDAAHRERLSREIPGLSPRQVQVWFQNRRAKIKRLTADDRERMMKMRAVPDGFDNVQALHSPYGAVHGALTPLQSPVDFVPAYGDQLMRPLMVDTMRRNENEEHMSPTGLSPSFGHVCFAPQSSMNTPDGLSPLSLNSADRYYPSHLSSPMSAGPQSANPFDRQNSYSTHPHTRQQSRPLKPLQLRDTMSRSRSESLQSPLRSSMSWKGETLDYGNYQTGHPSPQLSGRQQSLYRPDQIGNSAIVGHQLDINIYTNTGIQPSPPSMTYSPSNGGLSASIQQSSPSAMSRLRATSSTFPPGHDLRNQYRTVPSHNNPLGLSTPRSASFTTAFTGGYASAPLSSPIDFSLPGTPNDSNPSQREFSSPQLSAPMAPPQDFSTAYSSDSSPSRVQQGEREFGNQGQHSRVTGVQIQQGQTQGQGRLIDYQQRQQQDQHSRSSEEASYIRAVEYEAEQERKRSFTAAGTLESP